MKIKLIWSTDVTGVIGINNQLAQTSKADMQYFKELTSEPNNNVVVMGRKTYESIGKPLPNRFNIVLTKDNYWQFDTSLGEKLLDCHKSMSIHNVLKTCKEVGTDTLWVIGGKEIYEQFFELADELVITTFDHIAQVDLEQATVFLPDLTNFEPTDAIGLYDYTGSVTTWRRTK